MGFLASLAGSSSIKIIAVLAVVFGLIGFGAWGQAKIDSASSEKQTLQYEQAINAANQIAANEQHQIDSHALAASNAQSNMLQRQNATLRAELSDVSNHVTAKLPCISYGLVRVLDAAVLGTAAGNLALPAGKFDSSCSTFTADDLARSIVSNYATANANAEQLNALEALLKQLQADRVAAQKAR